MLHLSNILKSGKERNSMTSNVCYKSVALRSSVPPNIDERWKKEGEDKDYLRIQFGPSRRKNPALSAAVQKRLGKTAGSVKQ